MGVTLTQAHPLTIPHLFFRVLTLYEDTRLNPMNDADSHRIN